MYQVEATLTTQSSRQPRTRAKSLLSGNGAESVKATESASSAETSKPTTSSTLTDQTPTKPVVSVEAENTGPSAVEPLRQAHAARSWQAAYHTIVEAACMVTGIRYGDLSRRKCRHRQVVAAREIVVGLTRVNTIYSFPQIQKMLWGAGSHSTAVTAHGRYLEKCKGEREPDPNTLCGRETYADLVRDIAKLAMVKDGLSIWGGGSDG